jgi:hypothetical protein
MINILVAIHEFIVSHVLLMIPIGASVGLLVAYLTRDKRRYVK